MSTIDLSHSISAEMPVFPGSSQPAIENLHHLEEHGWADKQIKIQTHHGTHLDAPSHMLKGAPGLDQLPLDNFAGPACVIRLHNHSGPIEITDLIKNTTSIAASKIVLLNTGWSRYWGEPEYFEDYPCLSRDSASWLADQGIKGLGIDALSVDPADCSDCPIHHILFEKNIFLIENLTSLEKLPPSGFILVAAPLKIEQADGSPVRALALVN